MYFLARMLEHQGETLEGKRLIVSGFGNMSWGVCRKAAELGGRVGGSKPAPPAAPPMGRPVRAFL